MSNQIFCNVNKAMCDNIKAIAGERIVIDCGAGRGLFSSMYEGKALSIDIQQPKEPLSLIIEKQAEHYCFPKDSIPIFIRPCHSNFVHDTIFTNRNKFDKAIYVSMPENLKRDLDMKELFYKISQYSEWIGDDGERIYLVELNKSKENFNYLPGKVIHFSDPMLSALVDTQEQEFKECVESPLEDKGILIDGLRLNLTDMYPRNEMYDYLFFDYGGISMGNSLMESFCREIIRDADRYPNRTYIVVSTFTSYAMKDAKDEFGTNLQNVFLSINDFVSFHKEMNQLQ
jgi:hypothetical protein